MHDIAGGPAFPRPGHRGEVDEAFNCPPEGMSLRDWFAGMALQGFCANGSQVRINNKPTEHYDAAYIVADEMIKRRQ